MLVITRATILSSEPELYIVWKCFNFHQMLIATLPTVNLKSSQLFCAFKLSLHFCNCCKQLKSWIHLLLRSNCVCHRVQQNIKIIADKTYRRRWRSLFRCLAEISNALLSTVLSSPPVICAAVRVNTQTVETQLAQVPRRFCRITCEPGLRMPCA